MSNAGKTIMQKAIALLIIFVMIMADFLLITINTVTYAAEAIQTNSKNVEISAYFENTEGEKIKKIESTTDNQNIKLKVDINVKNEGYLEGKLTFNEANFKIKKVEKSDYIQKVEENTITLKQINAGTVATIEIEIEFNENGEIDIKKLNSETKITLTGNYVYSKKSIKVEGETAIQINWKSSENTEALLNTELLTYSNYKLQNEERKIAQILVESKIKNNTYPVKNTKIEMTVPQNVEEVTVQKRTTKATNGDKEFNETNYNFNKENHTLTINVANEENNGKINYQKDSKDTFIVTYKYAKEPNSATQNNATSNSTTQNSITQNSATQNSTTQNSTTQNGGVQTTPSNATQNSNQENTLNVSVKNTITTYDSRELENHSEIAETKQKEGIVTNKIETAENQIYRGKLYTGEEREYRTTTKLNIDLSEAVKAVEQKETNTKYISEKEEKEANVKYKQTKINKQELINLLGEEGSITIKNQDGIEIATINKDTEADEEGNIAINYETANIDVKNITITTSKPKANGEINFNHTKTIQNTEYPREKIKEFTAIKESIETTYTKTDDTTNKTKTNKQITLKETESKANLQLTKSVLSVAGEKQNLQMRITLESNDETKDLYKNAKIKITLPKQITKLTTKCKLLYGNGLKMENATISKENENQIITLDLKGEQKTYPENAVNGATAVIYAEVELNKLATNSNEQIKVNYKNENATKYADGGEQKANIQIINEKNIILTNNISKLNIWENGTEAEKEVPLKENADKQKLTVNAQIINNENKDISNITILGKIPKVENKITKEGKIAVSKQAEIYYTNVENPTNNIEETSNKWSKTNTKDATNYLIKLADMKKDEEVKINYDINLKEKLGYNVIAEAGYKINYDTNNSSEEEKATTLKLTTGTEAKLSQTLTATVGEDTIKNGDEVKAGEIIKYNLKLKNTGKEDAKNVKINAKVPEGTTLIEVNEKGYYIDENAQESTAKAQKKENTENADGSENFEDISTDTEEQTYFKNSTSQEIKLEQITVPAETEINYTFMVQVKQDIQNDQETTLNITTEYKDQTKTEQITHKIKTSNFLITTVPVDRLERTEITAGYHYNYLITIKNNSDKEQKNVKVNLNKNELIDITSINYDSEKKSKETLEPTVTTIEKENEAFEIPSIEAGDTIYVSVEANIKQPTKDIAKTKISATVQDKKGDIARSNTISETVKQLNVDAKLTAKISSENANSYIEPTDTIKYKINVTNTGKKDLNNLTIKDMVSSYLNVTNVTVDGKKTEYDTYYETNEAQEGEKEEKIQVLQVNNPLYAGKSAEVEVTATVEEALETTETLKITNKADVYNDVYLASTEEINYYIEPNLSTNTSDNDTDDDDIEEPSRVPTGEETVIGGDTASSNTNTSENDTNSSKNQNKITHTISGTAWLDENTDGERQKAEEQLSGITVYAINVKTNQIAKDANGTEIKAQTNNEGFYSLTNIPEGSYLIAFEYNTDKYMVTKYQADKVSENKNSDTIDDKITVNNEERQVAVTDKIDLKSSIANIDLGLIETKTFDLELKKVITKVVVTNKEGTKTYDEKETNLAKIEIAGKHLNNTNVVIEYKIKVKNNGEIAGYAQNIVDYIPSSLNFSGALNKGWYQSGQNIYNTTLSKTKIEPGETKEITLVLTKMMTESNTGLINNRAEIETAYNSLGIQDVDSTPNNQEKSEDDMGSADLIIGVKTGAAISYIILTLTTIIVIFGIAYIINKKILKKQIKI